MPIGTVLFVQTTLYPFKFSPIARATSYTAVRSEAPFSPSGVPTAMNITSALRIASSTFAVKDNRLKFTFLFTNSCSPGSYIGISPLLSCSILVLSMSAHTTL